MFKVGMFAGKFLPPHRGHLFQIINAATECEKLYVVVSDNKEITKLYSNDSPCGYMDLQTRWGWLSIELQGFPHIKIITIDETDIPIYPLGWRQWSGKIKKAIPEEIDAIFSGDSEYENGYRKWFPNSKFILFDYKRSRYPISSTEIRKNPLYHWDYILGSARPFFTKKVLVTGTESCGKTTLVKYLAKTFYTSWSEEVGRDYANKFLGGNESVFTHNDFARIAYLQYENDIDALKKANKVVFYDTDAVVTQYYSKLYLKEETPSVENFIDPSHYDMLLFLTPDVKWVGDGQRRNGGMEERKKLNQLLFSMYYDRGFDKISVVNSPSYNDRLLYAIKKVDLLLNK